MNMTVSVNPNATHGILTINNQQFECRLGRSSVIAEDQKREGDGATPLGTYIIRKVFYRPDRLPKPITNIPTVELQPNMGWCDDPQHPQYNKLVTLPFSASHEELWREDHVYDIIVTIGHNDAPPVAGMGSAIFLHLEHPEKTPTAGCVALTLEDMQTVLGQLDLADTITIKLV